MKKTSLIIMFILSLLTFSVTLLAQEYEFAPSKVYQDGYIDDYNDAVVYFSAELDDDTVEDLKKDILHAWKNLQDTIDIRKYNFTDYAEIKAYVVPIYQNLLNEKPEFFYVSGALNYTPNELSVIYNFEKAEIPAKIEALDNAVDNALKVVDIESMTSIDIAIALHDYLVLNGEYDNDTYVNNNTSHKTAFSAYGILVEKIGVCQSYTLAYNLLLSKCGIEYSVARSASLQHIWNIIKIDGEYYHVDVTWDDPLLDRKGISKYTYFLQSDSSFQNDGKHVNTWNCDYTATSDKYDNAFWKATNSTMAFLDGKYYFAYPDANKGNREYILAYGDTDNVNEIVEVREISDTYWKANNGSIYSKGSFRVVPFVYKDRLYYNSTTSVYRYSSLLEEDEVAYEHTSDYGYLVPQPHLTNNGMTYLHTTVTVEGGSASYLPSAPAFASLDGGHSFTTNTVPSQDFVEGYIEKDCPCGEHVKITTAPNKYLPGDIDLSGEVDGSDSVFFARYLAKWSKYPSLPFSANADVNNDGVVNLIDLIYLNRHISNWKGYTVLKNKYDI